LTKTGHPLSRRSETPTDCRASLSRRSVTKTGLSSVVPQRGTKEEAFVSLAKIIGKFGGADQLRNVVPSDSKKP